MKIHLLTLFPDYFSSPLSEGLMGKAIEDGLAEIHIHDLRKWTHDRHRTADDYAFGGGPGMVLKPEPFFEAMDHLGESEGFPPGAPVILTTPQGRRFDRDAAHELAAGTGFAVLCGRYRGVDERVRQALVTHEYSVGDVILNGGEAAALLMVEATVRLLPGVVGEAESAGADSFETGLLDHPHYTRPAEYRGMRVPDVLLSGHHAEIALWRRRMVLERTLARRPDLIEDAELDADDRAYLEVLRSRKGDATAGGSAAE
ncbi:tRNA (guanosine(37)-N1)-methyltransferase TrmD [Gemmatimonadota bacterium]